ncbi:hypothetical protein MBLNU459_g6218t1 [Dothideomycetes sp. NU459]
MPLIKKPRLSCFYCGSRSPHLKDGKTRVFDCQSCEATNYLDQNGDITDPPATPTVARPAVFARRARPSSPTSHLQDKPLFCKTCLQNQHLLTSCLAQYLPPEDDPEYEKYEAQYPQYLKDLQRRYPQVCAKCAPKVQDRIRKTGYAAKVDFLTKSLERSKSMYSSAHSPWTNVLLVGLSIVSLVWWASTLLQISWHGLGVLGIYGSGEQVNQLTSLKLVGCTVNGIRAGYLDPGCAHRFSHLVRTSLLSSLAIVWWNPAMQDRLKFPRRQHHFTGLTDFYRFQAVILSMRFFGWSWLGLSSDTGSDDMLLRAKHFFMLLFITFSALGSQRMIVSSSAPKVSFRDTTGPLVEADDFQYPTDNFTSQRSFEPPASYLNSNSPSSLRSRFTISSLAPQQERHSPLRNPLMANITSPPTPPPEADTPDAADSMDWEPITQQVPQSRPILNLPIQSSQPSAIPSFLRPAATASTGTKSPFTGRLPPAPISPAHRLRNPPAPPQFKPTPLSKQQDFFSRMGLSSATLPTPSALRVPGKKRFTTEAEADQENQTYVASAARENDPFRPAQWTLKSDMDAATKGTGLEDMFTTSFTIADGGGGGGGSSSRKSISADQSSSHAPAKFSKLTGSEMFEVRERQERQQQEQQERQARAWWIASSWLRLLALPVMFAFLAVGVAFVREPLWLLRALADAKARLWD